jgi:LacI family transcriptional regulator
VPHDVSVVGFDDIPLSSHQRIALTTVRTDAAALGARSVDVLIAASRTGTAASARESHPWQLVLRASTAPAR